MTEHTPHTIDYPGNTGDMPEQPRDEMRDRVGRGLLDGKKALVTGGDSATGRACHLHPDEIAPSYVFFAAGATSSYYSGEILAPIGGETLPG